MRWLSGIGISSLIASIVLLGLASFGLWDPWELSVADEARALSKLTADGHQRPPLATWIISAGFELFGVHNWSGRLPIALCGLFCLIVLYAGLRVDGGTRVATYAVLIAASSPLFLMNSRQLLGDAPSFAFSTLVFFASFYLVYPLREFDVDAVESIKPAASKWFQFASTYLLWMTALVLALFGRGILLAIAPPVLAVGLVTLMDGALFRHDDRFKLCSTVSVLAVSTVAVVLVVQAIFADAAEYSHVLGGKPIGDAPPSFDVSMEQLFHGFAPWSALLVLGAGHFTFRNLGTVPNSASEYNSTACETLDRSDALRLSLLLWIALSYGAVTLFSSRYGTATFPAVAGAAAMVAILLRDLERRDSAQWMSATVILLLVGLLVRDYALYPESPASALAIRELSIPGGFKPSGAWVAMLMLFAACVALGMGGSQLNSAGRFDLSRPYRFIASRWKLGWSFRTWIVFTALLNAALFLFSLMCISFGDSLPLTSIIVRWGIRLGAIPAMLPLALAGGALFLFLASKLVHHRAIPMIFAGMLISIFTAHSYVPNLSAYLSPQEAYDAFNELAGEEAELGEYRVGTRAAAYYARGTQRSLEHQSHLIDYLQEGQRRWAVLPTKELPAINRLYRKETGEHLFVAYGRDTRDTLITNQPIDGRNNENFLAAHVLRDEPEPVHRTNIVFEGRVALLGYDLELPHPRHVGPGESFTVTWYWKALSQMPGSYKVFLHLDGQGHRLNGDHVPVDGNYPLRLWDKDDIIVDRQTLTIPGNYRTGTYTLFVGFFSGDTRLKVTEGPRDGADRAMPGTVRVR
ncbi:MAG: glycosyltransferase family 39 protein [Myxococcota bacterium]